MEKTMGRLRLLVTACRQDVNGATALEYALIAGGVFLAIVPAVAIMADGMNATYQEIMGYFSAI